MVRRTNNVKYGAYLLAVTIALSAVTPAVAQFEFMGGGGGQSSKPWADFKLDKNKTVKLDFRNASPDLVIQVLSKASGITIIKDPALVQPMTITNPNPLKLDAAFSIFKSTLGVMQFDLSKEDNSLVIKKRQNQGGRMGGFDPAAFAGMFAGNQEPQVELKVYPIKYANASAVARVVNDVFQSNQQPQNPLQQMISMFQPGRGGMRPGGMGGNQSGMNVRASADDYSNSVIVNAPSKQQGEVEKLIKEIDKQVDETQRPIVYPLTYASSDELQPVVQNVLQANAPLGRNGARGGGTTGGGNPFQNPFMGGFRFGGGGGGTAQTGIGSVISEARTNSLIVTATEENHKLVSRVLQELDQEVTIQNTTFVMPLQNARADQVATLFQQAFGSRSGAGGRNTGGQTSRNTGNTNNRNNQNNNRNTGGGAGGGGNRGFAPTADGKSLDVPIGDPNGDGGELATEVYAQVGGFGGFGGFGGQNQNRTNQNRSSQTGRDEQGRLINIRDLQNQITVIPDTNTNSLIVVTTPENAELVQSILGQLDKIPEQVMIETIIVEATLDSSSKLGVEWTFLQGKAFGNTGTNGTIGSDFNIQGNTQDPPQGFKYSLTGGNLDLFMNALKSDTRFEVLSTPRIFTSNNVQAEINISQSVPYVLSSREDANGNLTFTYAFQDVGIVLTVTPRITANGYVTMDVVQTANDLQGFTDFNAPIVNQRQADTTVTVKDGETIILGGIIRNTVTSTTKKIPLLGDIPILGNLFKSTSKSNQKTELLVFLTPRVVRNPDDASHLRQDLEGKMSPTTRKVLERAMSGAAMGGGHSTQTNGKAGDPTKAGDPPKTGGGGR
ncbi:MAG: hypothetical protein KIS66_12120 [Fimbriimonadaceae bacterium]|nr:hypothetical protein [Fimbriimonadaceae bacterium]